MSLRVYAVEGFLFGVICWAWLSAEQMFVQGLVLDTFVLLGTLALGTLNLVLVSLAGPQEAPECAKCYAALILAAWFFYAYCLCDSLGLTPEGALWPPALNSTCCVNADAPALHRLGTDIDRQVRDGRQGISAQGGQFGALDLKVERVQSKRDAALDGEPGCGQGGVCGAQGVRVRADEGKGEFHDAPHLADRRADRKRQVGPGLASG